MTVEEYNKNLQAFMKDLERSNPGFGRAVQSSVQEIGNRIFVEGKNSKGELIGEYNTTDPLYINPKTKSPKSFPPKGMEGETKFKNGNSHKTGYFDSYSDFRKQIGRESKNVNLVLSGDLQSDFRKAKVNSPAKATKINENYYTIQLDRALNEKKMEGNEKRFGEITTPQAKEVMLFNEIANKEFINSLSKAGLI